MNLPIKITLPDHFLDREVRCGYEVPEKLKKIWAVELDLLAELDRVCKKHGIKYRVFCGTLLGAIRHKGFIPWDDDADVAFARQDFEKLCAIGPSEFKHPYFFQTALTDNAHFISEARLRNSETTCCVKGQEGTDYNNGIYIDLYVLDGVCQSRLQQNWQDFCLKVVRKFMTSYHYNGHGFNTAALIKRFARMVPYAHIYSLYHRILMWHNEGAVYFGLVTHGPEMMKKYRLKSDEMDAIVEMPFENLLVPVPKNYDCALTRIYGDYMTPPPAEVRGKWHEGVLRFEPEIPYMRLFGEVRSI